MSRFPRVLMAVIYGVSITSAIAGDDPTSLLSGGSSREWVFQRIVLSMGVGDDCTIGETYTFSKSHELTIRQCSKGHLVTTRSKWSVMTKDGDTLLQIEGDTGSPYVLEFKTDAQGHKFMRLRTKPVDQKHDVVDKEFKLNED